MSNSGELPPESSNPRQPVSPDDVSLLEQVLRQTTKSEVGQQDNMPELLLDLHRIRMAQPDGSTPGTGAEQLVQALLTRWSRQRGLPAGWPAKLAPIVSQTLRDDPVADQRLQLLWEQLLTWEGA